MPSFSMRDLPLLLRNNKTNHLISYARDGSQCIRNFLDIYVDACAVVGYLDDQGCRLGPQTRAVIVGDPGYDWLLAALACLFTGTEVVALPETLADEEVVRSLAGISFDFVLTADRLASFSAFSDVPQLPLQGLGERTRGRLGPKIDTSPRVSVVAFTSGSTSSATLKAFQVDLMSTAPFIDAFTNLFGITHDDLWAVCHSFTHIPHLEYVLGGFGWGYNVAVTDVVTVLMNGAQLQPSVLVSVPSVYEQIANQIRRRFPKSGGRATEIEDLLNQPLTEPRQRAIMPEAVDVMGARLKMMLIGAAPSSAALKSFLIKVGLPLFEGYGMSEIGMISCNVPSHSREGTVGRVWPGVEMKLDDEGVVWSRLNSKRTERYLNVADEENAKTFMTDGWINTGDLGEIEDGFLRIVGRKKEIIITSGGKNVNAAAIEARLRDIPKVGHALVFGDRRPFLVAVFAPSAGVALPTSDELFAYIERINPSLPVHERVLDFVRLETPLDVDNGLLTRSGKPRRLIVAQRYEDLIARCYE